MYPGFQEFDVDTPATTIHGRWGGSGPAVLLLHGIPQTHLMWHRVAPALAERFTVVASDLRGFGGSGTPASDAAHTPYSMRELAEDQVAAMRALGHDTFAVVGHDRGARCAYRMALDHPDEVRRLAVLDTVPTGEAYRRAGKEFSLRYWVWSFLAAPEPVPERLIAGDPATLVDHMLDSWSEDPEVFGPEQRAAYLEQFRSPERVHAICEQYRAAATPDVEHDEADRGHRRIGCPTLALWSAHGAVVDWYEPLEVWRAWCDDVRGGPVPAGHFIPEEAPEETARRLLDFLAG
ncbi:MAG TPA: alpha/beta hydrolase [Pseudonocardia sp.]